jgi:D-apionolactonase
MQIRNNLNLRGSNLSRRQLLKKAMGAGSALALSQSGWTLALLPSSGFASSDTSLLQAATAPKRETGLSRSVLYYGSEEPLAEVISLNAGPLSMLFETRNAFLRYIRLGDREVLRGIYVAVRDQNWGTVAPRIFNLRSEVSGASFQLRFDVECKEGDIDFVWKGNVIGSERGELEFSMSGAARSTFKRNRLGFAVLHPIKQCAGQPCKVEKTDGTIEKGTFPLFVSPQQPFKDMRAISHQVVPGVTARVAFEGDIFEMEDQRNWTDASYKTYCTPLSLPYPVEVPSGTTLAQTIRLSLEGNPPRSRTIRQIDLPQVILHVGDKTPFSLPLTGLGTASHSQPLTDREKRRLKALSLSHLRVDLKLSEGSHKQALRRAAAESREMGVPLEAALFLSDLAEAELTALLNELDQVKPAVKSWLVFQTSEKSTKEAAVRLARQILTRYDPKTKFGAGTNAYFAEFNRGRPPIEVLDLACYSVNPQVHAVDNATLVETLEAQRGTVESAKQFVGKVPLAISPITLKPRFNPAATGPEPEPAPGELPSQVDVRQMSLFGACWTLGSIKSLAESGVSSLTYYETTGWRGVMETETGSSIPQKFRSFPGGVFPLYHVLCDIGEFRSASVVSCTSSDTLSVEGLVLQKDDRVCLLLANFTPKFQYVTILNSRLGGYVRLRRLDETTAEEAMRSPESFRAKPGLLHQVTASQIEISLLPFAVVRVEPARERI